MLVERYIKTAEGSAMFEENPSLSHGAKLFTRHYFHAKRNELLLDDRAHRVSLSFSRLFASLARNKRMKKSG